MTMTNTKDQFMAQNVCKKFPYSSHKIVNTLFYIVFSKKECVKSHIWGYI